MTDAPADLPVDAPADPPADPPTPPAQPPATGTGDHDAAMARMRRETEEANKRAKAAEDKVAEAERKKAEEQGEFQKLAEQEKARADALEAKQREDEQRRNAERAAGDLKFRDPGYALYLLAQDRVDLADPAAVRDALDRIAKARTDLVTTGPPPPSGGPAGGANNDPPGLTVEQLQAMTPRQIAALDPEVIKKATAGIT